jgi:glycine betaine/proline transport system substrate-binding protein
MKIILKSALSVAAIVALSSGLAMAKDAGSCKTVRFSDVGWTDITATTAATSEVLKGLGYTPEDRSALGACHIYLK